MTQKMADDDLAAPESIDVQVVEDRTAEARCDEGFLRLRRLTLRNLYADGTSSADYPYDLVERDAMDAVAIVLSTADEPPRVCLRTALRPPLSFRGGYSIPVPEPRPIPVLWEVPAGLIEPTERGEAGILACAARETLEETGLDVPADSFGLLGPAASLSPGVLGEKIHFAHAVVDPARRGAPTEDGTPVEERAQLAFVSLPDALAAVRDGRVADVKTEVAIRRLADCGVRSSS